MRTSFRLVRFGALALLAAGCGQSIEVRTMAAPDAGLSALHTFRVLPGPTRRDGRAVTGTDDPMISNSIANQVMREQIVKSFQDRGYTLDELNPDFGVAFYASAREKLDVSLWDYGYPYGPGWPRYSTGVPAVAEYTEGSVVIDVVKPDSRTLLWRGQGTARLSDDAADNVKQLAKAAAAIVAQFPHATSRVVAARP